MSPPALDGQALAREHGTPHGADRIVFTPSELEDVQERLDRAHARFAAGSARADESAAAEWLLDNDHLIQQVLRQLDQEFPPGFQRNLPALASGEVRVQALARAATSPGVVIDEPSLCLLVDDYQVVAPLTIAELWALPAVLRWSIVADLADELEARATEDLGAIVARAVTTLRLFDELDWEQLFCEWSVVERTLARDVTYPQMDAATRDAYRQRVEALSFAGGRSEPEVVETALDLAAAHPTDEVRGHVGHWLLGGGRRELERAVGVTRLARARGEWMREHPRLVLLGLLALVELALLGVVVAYAVGTGASAAGTTVIGLLTFVPLSMIAVDGVHRLITHRVPPRQLAKLDFSKGIPARWRTLVAVPTLLSSDEAIEELVEALEVRYLGNPDPELRYALLTDHPDTDEPPGEEHAERLERAARAIRELNERHGTEAFHLLHRESRWNPAERCWMGWERKRGKLEELHRRLRGEEDTSYAFHEGSEEGLAGIAFVISLDSDTRLPPGTAARLVGTLAHPSNRPRFDERGRVVGGYTVIQPRVEVTPQSANRSAFGRLFAGDTGLDVYTRAVSEVYQDLFAEAVYVGKGIHDVDAFARSLAGRVPENRIVSHDLFEGLHGRVALATDIVLYEEYPPHYGVFLHRMHRWVRGDWQLVPWLAHRVPMASGQHAQSSLDLVDRFKIADNLRRSLVSPALLLLLVAGWLVLPGHPAFWSGVAVLCAFSAPLSSLLFGGRPSGRSLARSTLLLVFLVAEAFIVLDAVVRVAVRLLFTHRKLLEWTTAAQSSRALGRGRSAFIAQLFISPVAAVGLTATLAFFVPSALPWAAPFLIAWFLAPELAFQLSRPPQPERERATPEQQRFLRRSARRTWLFFETFVGPSDQWLPPDHHQEAPGRRTAHRTSPTNIGLGLLSELAAYDLGYAHAHSMLTRASNTIGTIERLPEFRGHIYNWYDTQTLETLEPRYVSTVDSGNLAGALLTLAQGCDEAIEHPPIRPAIQRGLQDTAELLGEAIEAWLPDPTNDVRELVAHLIDGVFEADGPLDAVERLTRHLDALERGLLAELRSRRTKAGHGAPLAEVRVWLDRLHKSNESLQSFIEGLPEGADLETTPLDALAEAPEGAFAAELVTDLRALAARARALADRMDFSFLYDSERKLFHVGYDATASRLDHHHYDLLASEARLASFLATTRGQVPLRHWFTLGRPVVSMKGHVGLASWGGSMFEHLMPTLLTQSAPGTLLAESYEGVIAQQIAYGRSQGVPWGISESGYAILGADGGYQYRCFGVPSVGLQRGLETDLVIAPYASFLALPFRPRAVIANLLKLRELGMIGRHGFFEAADFSPTRSAPGGPSLVRSYMAHHQGMSLVALANFFEDDVMVRRFHSDPHVASAELLLDERAPKRALAARQQERFEITRPSVAPPPPEHPPGWLVAPSPENVWALGNGSLTALVDGDGAVSLRAEGYALTRGTVGEPSQRGANALYLEDLGAGTSIPLTPGPVRGWSDEGRVELSVGSAEFLHPSHGLTTRTRLSVTDTACITLVEITNRSHEERRLRVVSTLEPAVEPLQGAGRHPAFAKLFVRCSADPSGERVTVTRVFEEGKSPPVMLLQAVADADAQARVTVVDRGTLLGRRGSIASPRLDLAGAAGEPTLDPVCVGTVDLQLPPGGDRTLAFVTAVGADATEVRVRADRLRTLHAVRWAVTDAERAAARRASRMGLSVGELPLVQRLLGALVTVQPALRADADVLERGRPAQPKLWRYGISGDHPIVLLRTEAASRSPLLTDLLHAQRYLEALGIPMDTVIVDRGDGGYLDEGRQDVRRILVRMGIEVWLGRPGGVHRVRMDPVADEQEMVDLHAAARVVLDDAAGAIGAQLEQRPELVGELPIFAPAGRPPGTATDPEPELAIPSLVLGNDWGGFDGDDYLIRPDAIPPAPWCNVLANPDVGCLVSDSGLGTTWSLNAGENRLTPWSNDPVADPPSEVLYLRDEETGYVWSTTPLPCGPRTVVRHGFGYSTYEQVVAGLRVQMRVFVPPDTEAKILQLEVENLTDRPRRLTATHFVEWLLGTRWENRAHIRTTMEHEHAALLARNSWSEDHADRVAFQATNATVLHGFTGDRREFLGPDADARDPEALRRWGLAGRVGPTVEPCGALQVHLDLIPGERERVAFFLGQAADQSEALQTITALRGEGAIERAWTETTQRWRDRVGAVRVRTPDEATNRLLNGWLLYQSLASRFFGRAGFYQAGGAYGFRDQLQDMLAYLHCEPELARTHLLRAAAQQFQQGDALHWWHPPGDAGVRTRCSDDRLWLVYAAHGYVEATGDDAVLQERVPWRVAEPLRPEEEARYRRFPASEEQASLLDHCRRALEVSFTEGPHGLPLIGDGDWNDGMNRIGIEGRGESVWLGFFLVACAKSFAALLDRMGEETEARSWRERADDLGRTLDDVAWDGQWYRRAFHDDGTPIGSRVGPPPNIDSIAQSWSVISGVAPPARATRALASAEERLVLEAEQLVLLLTPPYHSGERPIGYIAAYPPGIRENGGQYTHAAIWLGWAFAERGENEAAHRIFCLLNPLLRTREAADVERYGVEPYVVAADIGGWAPFVGRGGWTWYTGAAAWLHRLGVEKLLGLRLVDGDLVVEPRIPPHWPGFEAWVRVGEGTVHVTVDNTEGVGGVSEVTLDGERLEQARVRPSSIPERRLHVRLGHPALRVRRA